MNMLKVRARERASERERKQARREDKGRVLVKAQRHTDTDRHRWARLKTSASYAHDDVPRA